VFWHTFGANQRCQQHPPLGERNGGNQTSQNGGAPAKWIQEAIKTWKMREYNER